MQDEESFSFHLSKSQVLSSRSDESILITLERSQKLDLLIHLITNLRQSLVVCGPVGIGKTILLGELKERKHEDWPIVNVLGSDGLSFESIQKQVLNGFIQFYPEYKNQELSSILSSLDKQGQKIVVVIGRAGQLVPGLISSIIEYAATNDCLRVIFSLTQDELHLKHSSDKAIDDCHFIDIPPLTEKQCRTFLQNLSAKPEAVISFNAISEQMVEKVYRKTHGIPGKIVAELPGLSNYSVASSYQWLIYVSFVAIAVLAGLQFFDYNDIDEELETEQIKTALFLDNIEDANISPPVVYTKTQEAVGNKVVTAGLPYTEQVDLLEEPREVVVESEIEPLIVEASPEIIKESLKTQDDPEEVALVAEKNEAAVELGVKTDNVIDTNLVEESISIEKEQSKETLEVKASLRVDVINDDRLWVLGQSKKNYTIQIMVLSTRKAVDEFIRKNNSLKEQLKFFQVNKQNQKYILIFGSFKSAVSASKKMKTLPVRYRKSWVRKIRDLQKEIKK